jgi:hypothetical protein
MCYGAADAAITNTLTATTAFSACGPLAPGSDNAVGGAGRESWTAPWFHEHRTCLPAVARDRAHDSATALLASVAASRALGPAAPRRDGAVDRTELEVAFTAFSEVGAGLAAEGLRTKDLSFAEELAGAAAPVIGRSHA